MITFTQLIQSSRTKDGAIYLDNAATSWPKPPGVAEAMLRYMGELGANPGRSAHRMSIQAARVIYRLREKIAAMFGAVDPLRVIFSLNVTDALNIALHGLLKPGDHVLTSSMEHNAVMRPLNDLAQRGVSYTKLPCQPDGNLDPDTMASAIRPETRLIVMNHASNVCGTILPIREVAQLARVHGLLFLLDSAQSAGALPIDMQADSIDLLAFTGHKSLYGPTGTGGLIIGDRVDPAVLHPLRQGGTGSRSEHEVQPDFLPDRYECGTPNGIGLAGLLASLEWIEAQGQPALMAHERALCQVLIDALTQLDNVTVYGTRQAALQTATLAFNIKGMQPSEVGLRLDEEFGILSRVGLHCAPAAHKTIGTFPAGCVRFGIGAFNTLSDIEQAVQAVSALAGEVAK